MPKLSHIVAIFILIVFSVVVGVMFAQMEALNRDLMSQMCKIPSGLVHTWNHGTRFTSRNGPVQKLTISNTGQHRLYITEIVIVSVNLEEVAHISGQLRDCKNMPIQWPTSLVPCMILPGHSITIIRTDPAVDWILVQLRPLEADHMSWTGVVLRRDNGTCTNWTVGLDDWRVQSQVFTFRLQDISYTVSTAEIERAWV
jgi:hypothetical protein